MQDVGVVFGIGCARIIGFSHFLLAIPILVVSVLPIWLVWVVFSPRPLRVTSNALGSTDQSKPGYLGQPRLLATQVSHTRLGVGHYNYTVPHFLIGTPVGLQGGIGSILSLDEESSPARPGASTSPFCSLFGWCSVPKAWFTIHAHHHLEKGNDSIGLRGKLRHFLQSQGEDADEWPYAYLVTMPQFIGYRRNLVCFWYLYSDSRELTAMIMEVNNYWGQRKLAFSRLTGEGPLCSPYSSTTPQKPSPWSSGAPLSSLFSNPRYRTYRGTWDKDMFISPFEKVEGSIALRLSDPLAPNGKLHIGITLVGASGKARVIGRVFCPDDHDSLDPRTASSCQLLRFLPYWTAVLAFTELLIIAAALCIRSQGAIRFYPMPEVRPGNLPRDETNIERKLETSFRHYLRHIVEHSHVPVRLHYIPSKSHRLQPETFASRPSTADSPTLTIQVLAPQFYTSVISYSDPITAFTTESRPSSLPTDPSSRNLAVSDHGLLTTLLSTAPRLSVVPKSIIIPQSRWGRFSIPDCLQVVSGVSFLGQFVTAHLGPAAQREYRQSVLFHHLADRVALGSHGLASMYVVLAYLAVQAGLFYVLLAAWRGVLGVEARPAAMICHWMVLKGWRVIRS